MYQNAKKSPPEYAIYPSCSPSRDSNYPYRPLQRFFAPSLEPFQLSKKAKDEEIERPLAPKTTPLPTHLPPGDEAYVDVILERGVMSKTGGWQFGDKDIARLRPRRWLNDEIVNFYGQLILSRSESQKKNSMPAPDGGHVDGLVNGAKGKTVGKEPPLDVHYFNTFFWTKLTGEGYEKGRLARWTKKVTTNLNVFLPQVVLIYLFYKFDLFSKDVILIPINHNNTHWAAAAINFRRKRIESYDSMGKARSTVHKVVAAHSLLRYGAQLTSFTGVARVLG